jgi:hypothetical protein
VRVALGARWAAGRVFVFVSARYVLATHEYARHPLRPSGSCLWRAEKNAPGLFAPLFTKYFMPIWQIGNFV